MKIFDRFKKKSTMGSLSDSPLSLVMNGSGFVFAFHKYTLGEVIKNYKSVSPLYTGVTRISESVGSLPLALKDKVTGELLHEHPFLSLLSKPNEKLQRTKGDLLRDAVIWKLLDGNSYYKAVAMKMREPVALYVLDPKYMTIQSASDGFPWSYTYGSTTQTQDRGESANEFFQRDLKTNRFFNEQQTSELYHDRAFNPDYGRGNLDGMSKVQPLWFEVANYLHATQHNLGLLQNGARPSGALVLKDSKGDSAKLNEEQFARLRLQMEEQMSGSVNTGRPIVLEGGLEWREMSINPKDMEFGLNKKDAEKQIYNALGVPLELVNSENATYNNKSEARLYFYENTVLPLAEDLLDRIGDWLLPRYKGGEKYDLVVDIDNVKALSLKRERRRKTIEESPVMTIAEKRKELGLDELPGTEIIVNATGLIVVDANGAVANEPPILEVQQEEAKVKRPFLEAKAVENEVLAVIEEIDGPTVYSEIFGTASGGMREAIQAFGAEFIREVSEGALFEVNASMLDFADQSAATMIRNISDTTKSELRNVVAQGIANGDSLAMISAGIIDVFPTDISDSRVAMIAITESTKLATFSAEASMKQAGIEKKEWLTVQDGKARGSHVSLDGKVVMVSEDFVADNGATASGPGMFGIAEEDINCRCTVIPSFGKAMTASERVIAWKRRENIREQRQKALDKTVLAVFNEQRTYVSRRLKKLKENF